MTEWREYRIGEVAQVFDGPHATPKKTSSGPWFLSISSLDRGRLNLAESAHLSEEDFVKWTRRVTPEPEDILFSYETRLGDAALMPEGVRACLGRRMGILRPNRNLVLPRFLLLAYLAPEFQATIRSRAIHGATVDRIPLTELPEWPICLPDLHRQAAIVGVLGALDDKISVNERMAATARELGLTLYAQALQDGETVQAVVESVVNALARGIAPKYTDSPEGLTVLNQKCIRNGRVNLEPSRLTLRERIRFPKLLQRNDVLVNSTGVGTLGRVARWTSDLEATADSHITIVRFDEEKVDRVCAGFAMLRAQPEIEAMGEGSTGQTELRRSQVGELELTLPSPASQKKLRPRLDALEERADQALRESLALATLRDTLLPQLMSGKLRVRDAEKIVEDAV
ncbi:restriction endonuclease subunit S [Streptomyces sp. NPDC059168]|uniref:restriction endonuclease subunit S n=1 Tax=Streptomyces sp. NPDC059168 TaxID=3346753 RepID=UPI0036AB92AA